MNAFGYRTHLRNISLLIHFVALTVSTLTIGDEKSLANDEARAPGEFLINKIRATG